MLSVAANVSANGLPPKSERKPKTGAVVKKTPIALLHEMCSKRKLGITPEYSLINTDGPVHAAEFTVQATLGDMVATGVDKSKQRARQASAMNLLINLIGVGWEVMPGLQPHLASEYVKSLMPEPVVHNKSPKQKREAAADAPAVVSPVSKLNELCMRQRWPLPVFTANDGEGVPKNREYSASARVGAFEQSATAGSKKEAKRQVAEKLLSLLQGNVTTEHLKHMSVDQQITAEVLKAMTDLVSARQGNDSLNPAVVTKIQEGLRQASKSKGKGSSNSDSVVMLAKVLDRCGFRATVHDIEKSSESADFECLYQLEIPTKLLCFGSGPSLDVARNNAAKAALQYLKLVARKHSVEE